MLKSNSIKNRLIFYLLITLIPIFSIIIFTGEGYIRNALYENALAKAKMLAFKAARNIENLTFDISTKPIEISKLAGYKITNLNMIKRLMIKDVKQSKFIYGMALAYLPKYSPNNSYFCQYYYKKKNRLYGKQLIPPSYHYTKFDWFKKPIELDKNIWSEPYFDKGGGEIWMSTYSAVIRNLKGEKIGIATADVSIGFLSKIIGKIKILKTGGAFLFTKNGNILAPLGDKTTTNKSVEKIINSYDKNQFKKLANSVSENKNNYGKIKVDNRYYLIYYTPIKNTNWILGVTFPKNELFLPIRNMEVYLFSIAGFGLLIVVILIVIISRRVTKDIQKIKDISAQIAKGDFNVDIPTDLTDESKDVAEALNVMQKSLKKFIKDVEEKAKIEKELKLAQQIQSSFVPNSLKTLLNGIEFKGMSVWAKQVGGDFYGINKIDENKVIFYLGDVSGKGIPAVLYVAMIKSMVEVLVKYTHSVKSIVEFLNNYFSTITTHHSFATMLMGIVDKEKNTMEFCNAGHTPPVIFKNRAIFMPVLSGNVPIGTFEGFDYKLQTFKLKQIDGMLIYSDGITDAQNSKKEQIGEEGLIEIVSKCLLKNEDIVETLQTYLYEFIGENELYDDTTLLSLYIKKEDKIQN